MSAQQLPSNSQYTENQESAPTAKAQPPKNDTTTSKLKDLLKTLSSHASATTEEAEKRATINLSLFLSLLLSFEVMINFVSLII